MRDTKQLNKLQRKEDRADVHCAQARAISDCKQPGYRLKEKSPRATPAIRLHRAESHVATDGCLCPPVDLFPSEEVDEFASMVDGRRPLGLGRDLDDCADEDGSDAGQIAVLSTIR
jgi:hypothetical protein